MAVRWLQTVLSGAVDELARCSGYFFFARITILKQQHYAISTKQNGGFIKAEPKSPILEPFSVGQALAAIFAHPNGGLNLISHQEIFYSILLISVILFAS